MGFFKKLFGAAAVTGAAIGGALYVKKRKDDESTETGLNDFDDFDEQKIFDINKDTDNDGNKKVTITFNSKKAKKVANDTADIIIDATDKAKDMVTEKLGEEKVDYIKEKAEDAKDKINDVTSLAMEKAKEVKNAVVDKVGEENIEAVKEKVGDAMDLAKDKVSETVDKIIKSSDSDFDDSDFNEDDFVDEDIEPVSSKSSDTPADKAETEDDVNLDDKDTDDEFLSDELEEL